MPVAHSFSVYTHYICMKRYFIALTAAFFVFFSLSLCSCSSFDPTFPEISENYEDLASKATITEISDGKYLIDFKKSATFNRLVLREKSDGVISFSLSLPSSPSPFYGNDFIGSYRYCSFSAVTTDKLLLSVTCENDVSFLRPEAYYIPSSPLSPFSVTSYITAKAAFFLTDKNKNPSDVFDIIYSAYLDKDGNVRFPAYYIDGEKISGETVLASGVANIRASYPRARILVTVLGDREFDNDSLTVQQRHSSAFSNKEVLSASLLDLLSEFGLDGISFDYEYPVSKSDYSLFTDFCAYFDAFLPENKLFTAAVSAWCVDRSRLSAGSLSCFDRVTLMAYDDPDTRGCHSTFYSAYSQLMRLKKQGVPLNRISLGLPLYSKPLDGSSSVLSYADYADSLPFFDNVTYVDCDGQSKACYFNGRQLVTDKTSLAQDIGLAGVSVWHYALDSSDPALSLLSTADRARGRRATADQAELA